VNTPAYQLVGRRFDRPDSLMFRDRRGRHFLRTSCGSRLVRITAHDATRLLQRRYHTVLDGAWRDELEATGLECLLPQESVGFELIPGGTE
jgi:hypothetical protein